VVLLTSTAALLTLIALVASIDGSRATVEGELVHYLRPADVGRVQYEITVANETRTIEVGTAEVVSVESGAAEVRLTSDRAVQPGFAVRFEVPFERVRVQEQPAAEWAESLLAARAELATAVFDNKTLSTRVAELEQLLENSRAGLAAERELRAAVAPSPAEGPQTAAAAPQPTLEQLGGWVRAWAEAWSTQDVQAYLSFYGEEFQPPKGTSRERWEAGRRERLQTPEFIEIGIDAFELNWSTSERAEVRFEQSYRSNTFRDRVAKMLELVLIEGEWKISKEEVRQPLARADSNLPRP